MTKSALRKINVLGVAYLWSRKHVHVKSVASRGCVEVLSIYQEGRKRSPLRLRFSQDENYRDWLLSPYEEGAIMQETGDSYINLNLPSVVATIIKYALSEGWEPNIMENPMDIDNGFKWLEKLEFPEPK